ncbi:MAG: hypothetical protein JWM95_3488 [Gemmatimonadetes bacterium]|nr:hypothetical protein [Gemmatimonadota bacterium]
MFHRWAALALVLALCAVPTKQAAGQQSTTQPRERKAGSLGQNFPNPFNPETRFPFNVELCEGGASTHVVTLKVYNVLAQVVAVPILEGVNKPLQKLTLACGQYVAFWDGKVLGTGKEAASGVYTYVLEVDGDRVLKKAFIAK